MKTTLKARLVLLGFVMLAAGISVNALILQYPRKPDNQEIRVNPSVAPAANRRPEGLEGWNRPPARRSSLPCPSRPAPRPRKPRPWIPSPVYNAS